MFPHLPGGALMMPLMVMRREHGDLWKRMDELAASLADPGDGIEDACAEILTLLDSHNAKEEPIIHPYLDSDLTEADRALVRDLLAVGTLPDGWVCQALR